MSIRTVLSSVAASILLPRSLTRAVAPLEITEVYEDESGSTTRLIVTGRNVDNGKTIALWPGELGTPLETVSISEQTGLLHGGAKSAARNPGWKPATRKLSLG